MSSWTNTLRNLFPLWTSNVWPTNSGIIVQARAQVLIGCLARFSFSIETLRYSFSLTNGPFFALLLIGRSFRNLPFAGVAGIGRTCGGGESVFRWLRAGCE